MRAFILIAIALIAALLPASTIRAEDGRNDDGIKVLILDKDFNRVPEGGEKLELMDRVEGRLVLGYSTYIGDITVMRSDKGLYLINGIPLEEYVEGVVKAEIGKSWDAEALKAQAVVVRTYVLSEMQYNLRAEYNITSSVLDQVYKGLNTDDNIKNAVSSTRGEVLMYRGDIVRAYYHSTSEGMTELPEEVFGKSYPYLKSVPADGRLSPYMMWTRELTYDELRTATGLREITDMTIADNTATGRVREVAFKTASGKVQVKAAELRRMIGWRKLPSTDFNVVRTKTGVILNGRGYGHGVGMCQWCALEMAHQGRTYKDILMHYYPGAEIRQHEPL